MPVSAPRDQNSIPAKLAVLNTDTVQGQHLVPIGISPNGRIQTRSDGTISFTPVPVDPRDENYIGCWLFEGQDGLTYPAVADSDGNLFVKPN